MNQIIRVTVKAGQKRDAVALLPGGRLSISTRAPTSENRANKAALDLIATHLNIPVKNLRVASGHQAPSKHIEVLGSASPSH